MVDETKKGAEIVNLRRARKLKARAERAQDADANRVGHGASKAVRALADARRAKADRELDAHKRARDDQDRTDSDS